MDGGFYVIRALPTNSALRRVAKLCEVSSWPRGVTVSTLDSESSDRGSNPREAFFEFAVPFACKHKKAICAIYWDKINSRGQVQLQPLLYSLESKQSMRIIIGNGHTGI